MGAGGDKFGGNFGDDHHGYGVGKAIMLILMLIGTSKNVKI
jgi:hypothetical protein